MSLNLVDYLLIQVDKQWYSYYLKDVPSKQLDSIPVLKLNPKVPIKTAADDIYKYFFGYFSEKIRLDISCESSARQRIHMKQQALFP